MTRRSASLPRTSTCRAETSRGADTSRETSRRYSQAGPSVRFPLNTGRRGYNRDEVDAFVDRVEAGRLDPTARVALLQRIFTM